VTDSAPDAGSLISELEDQERRLCFSRFDNDDAWALGSRLVQIAHERELPITIDIRRSGQQLFHVALPGTAPDNDSWVERKVRVVERFHASSYLVGRRLAINDVTLDEAFGVRPIEHATHGGAFPIRVTGVGVVGSVTVSGLAQADDHALVVEAITSFLADQSE
jgi:uncharacterized protein (UPF0303 family)